MPWRAVVTVWERPTLLWDWRHIYKSAECQRFTKNLMNPARYASWQSVRGSQGRYHVVCFVSGKHPMLPLLWRGSGMEYLPDIGSAFWTAVRIRTCCTQENADGYLLICGGKPWEWENSEEAAVAMCRSVQWTELSFIICFVEVCPFDQKQPCAEGLRMPYFEDPFTGRPGIGPSVPGFIWNRWFGQGGRTSSRSVFGEGIKRSSGRRCREPGIRDNWPVLGCGRGVGTSHLASSAGKLSDRRKT